MIGWMAWHLHRRGLVAFTGACFAVSFLYGFAFQTAAGPTRESQAAFGQSVTLVARQFLFLVPYPVHPETLGGYEQYKWLSGVVVVLMIWAALAGTGIGRGDEERGITDMWIAGGVSRGRLLLARSTAFSLVLVAACAASTLGISAVAPLVHQDPNLGGEIQKALSMAAGLLAVFGVALLVAQVPAERQTATALGVGIPVALLIVNGIADTVPAAAWIGGISPFHWMERTGSAAPGGTFDLGSTLGLAAAAVVLVGVALPAFGRRDVGSGLLTWRRRQSGPVRVASRNPMLRMPFTEGLWEQRVGLAAWVVGTMGLGAAMVSVTKSTADALFSNSRLAALFQGASPGPIYASLLGFIWFGFALLILAGYSVVQASRWSAQDQEGRVELLLSAPVSRSRVIIDRALEFATASLLIVVGGYLGVAAAIPKAGMQLDGGRVLTASILLWPFALAFGGLAVAVASRWPRLAVPALAGLVAFEYIAGDLGPIFQAPVWLQNLSVFHLYGNPVVAPAPWAPAGSMLLLFLAGFAAALFLMRRRDVYSA